MVGDRNSAPDRDLLVCVAVQKYERSREVQGSGVNRSRAKQPAREQLALNRAPNSEGSEEGNSVSDGSDTTLQNMTKKVSTDGEVYTRKEKEWGRDIDKKKISPLSPSLSCFCGLPGISSPMEGGYRFALKSNGTVLWPPGAGSVCKALACPAWTYIGSVLMSLRTALRLHSDGDSSSVLYRTGEATGSLQWTLRACLEIGLWSSLPRHSLEHRSYGNGRAW